MVKQQKINFAVVICLAFIFRLLFINLNIISSLNIQAETHGKKNRDSEILARYKNVQNVTTTQPIVFNLVEICEENSNDENKLSKKVSFVLLQVLFSLYAHNEDHSGTHLHAVNDRQFPTKKYLSISILRI